MGLTEVSNKAVMELNGWVVDTSNNLPFWEKAWCDRNCNSKTFYGFKWGVDIGTLKATFRGYGRAILDFGNCGLKGYTKVFLNNMEIGYAGPNVKSKVISFNYVPGNILWLGEHGCGIIKLNYLKLSCQGNQSLCFNCYLLY